VQGIAIALIFIASACGGRSAPPKPPPPLSKQLAAAIYSDFIALGEIAQRQRGKCAELTAELRPHVSRMKARKADVDVMLRDPKQTTELKAELATYANPINGLTDKIATNLAATYLTCCPRPPRDEPAEDPPKPDAKRCPAGYELERVIADMPTY
jgi:hypothetical protein